MKYLIVISVIALILFMLFGCGAAKPEPQEADVSDADAVTDAEEEVVSDAEVSEDASVDTESSEQ